MSETLNSMWGLAETCVALGQTFAETDGSEQFYEDNKDLLGGFPGVWSHVGHVGLHLENELQKLEDGSFDYIATIDTAAENIIRYPNDLPALIAKRSVVLI